MAKQEQTSAEITEQILRDLALIYISLAHSTDEELSDEESDTIAARLQTWQASASDEVLEGAVENALREYVKEDADERVREAVENVSEEMPHDLRQFILDDLMDIALADGRFLFSESSFIGELAQAWDIHPKRQNRTTVESWSVFHQEEEDGHGWTPVHDLGLIYLTMAHRTDDRLSSSEVEAIATKLSEWLPEAPWDDVMQVVKDALKVYVQAKDEGFFDDSVQAVQRAVPEHQRAALLEDLRYVAHADGEVVAEEEEMIARLADAWGISDEERR